MAKVSFLFVYITLMMGMLMVIMGQSFTLVRTAVDDAPEIIQKINKDYLVGMNEVILIYIYFLVFTLYFNALENGAFRFLFIVVNFVCGFIVMVMSADALRKTQDLSGYDDYKKLLKGLAGLSAVLTILFFGILMTIFFAAKKTSS